MKKYLFIVLLVGVCFGQDNLNGVWIDMENFNKTTSSKNLPNLNIRYIFEIADGKQIVENIDYEKRTRANYMEDPITRDVSSLYKIEKNIYLIIKRFTKCFNILILLLFEVLKVYLY